MKTSVKLLYMAALFVVAGPASAAVYVPGDPEFRISTEPGKTIFNSPVINGVIGVLPSAAGTFTDDFEFIIPQNGIGSGSVTTTANLTTSSNYIKFLSVFFNGGAVPISVTTPASGGVMQTAGLTNVPIMEGMLNTIAVTYTTLGAGSYGGQLTFNAAAVPETATWAMFLMGFGIVGFAQRRKDRLRANYAAMRVAV